MRRRLFLLFVFLSLVILGGLFSLNGQRFFSAAAREDGLDPRTSPQNPTLRPAPTAAPPVFGTREANPEARNAPAPYAEPKKQEDLASTTERKSFFAMARTLQERATRPDEQGHFTKTRVVEADFKYRLLRIEEDWARDAVTGVETMRGQKVMVADHFLVTLREGVTRQEFETMLEGLGGKVRRHLPNSQVYLVETGSSDMDVFAAKLAEFRASAVPMTVVEPDYVVFICMTPNDPSFSSLWGLHNTGQTSGTGDADIDAPEAWEVARGGSAVVVGVIDTGIDYTHPDLAANMWLNAGEIPANGIDDDSNGYVDDTRGWDFVANDNDPADDHYHGTHCAGTIGAVGDNGIGVAGVCHTVRLMALKFLSGSGGGTTSDAIEAVLYGTANRATMTSNSWGGGGYSQTLKDAIDAAGTAGLLFVAAAGNDSMNTDVSPSYPAAYDSTNIISVAASDHNDILAGFTNFGATTVDFAAPGVSIYSTSPGNTYRSLSGTSMACPHVAGACALIKAARPAMNWSDIKSSLTNNVDGVAAMIGKVATGGRMNVARSLIIATEPYITLATMHPSDDGLLGSSGNNDGILNPGEDVTLAVILKNVGAKPAPGLSTVLTVTSAGNKVTVLQGSRSWGDVPAGSAVSTGGSPFLIRIAAGTATPHAFTVNLAITDTAGHSWSSQTQMRVLTSSTVTGRVTALTGGAGIGGATVSYSGPFSGSVVSTSNGTYTLNLTDGTYQVRAAAPGYNPSAPTAVTVPPSVTAVDFALGRSRMQVTPATLASTQYEDSLATKTMTLTNEGDQPLAFLVNAASRSTTLSIQQQVPPSADPGVHSLLDASAETQPRGARDLTRLAAGTTPVPFADSFESGSLAGWASSSGAGTRQIVTSTAAAGSRSFYFNNQGDTTHFNGINRDFASGSKPKSVSFWVRSGSTTTHDGYFVLTDGTYGDDFIWFFARGGGKFYVNGDLTGGDETFSYQAEVWYRVEFKDLDWTAKNFDYYVNGTLVKANIPFRNPSYVDEMSQLWLYNFSTDSKAWWDDIRVMDTTLDWLTMAPDGGTLAPGQSATVTVTFNAADKVAGSYLGQVDISSNDPVNPVVSVPTTMIVQQTPNTPPVANAQAVSLNEDTQAVITLTGTDAEGHLLTAQIQTLPALGSLYQTSDGTNIGDRITTVPATVSHSGQKVIFVPPPNANGTPYASFQFIMRDKRSQSTAATVTLNVQPVNDLPVAFNDFSSGLPGQVITPIQVLLNDLEPDGQALTISSFTQGLRGTVASNGDGTLRFTPNASFTSGEDSFTYTVSDGAGGTSTASVQVAVGLLAAGAWPMMGCDAAHSGMYPGTLNGQLLSLAWSLQVSPLPLNQVSIAEGKAFATPDVNHSETQLTAVDLATGTLAWKKEWPVQASSLTGPAYKSGTLYVQRANGGGDSQLWALNSADGSTRWSTPFYTQYADYLPPTVTDSSVYINGGTYGGMYGHNRSTGAELFFSALEQVNGWTPAFAGGFVYTCVGGKLRQHHATTGAVNWAVTVSSNTYDMAVCVVGPGAAFAIVAGTSGRELVCVDLATQTVRWRQAGFTATPSVNASAVYAFDTSGNVKSHNISTGALIRTYTTGIGSTELYQPIITNDVLLASSTTATAIHSLATGVIQQSISAGGIPSLSNGYLLLAGKDGILRCYVVMAANTAPVATALTSTCVEDNSVTLTLPGTDPNGDSLAGIITSLPAKGALYQTTDGVQMGDAISTVPVLVRNPQRKVIYRPAPDGFGSPYTTFKFKVNDGVVSSAEATATINVPNVNDAPVAIQDVLYLRAGGILGAFLPTANDVDVDGEVLQIASFTAPAKGTLTQNGDATLRYVPQAGFTEGTDSFQYVARDGSGATASGTVQVLVSAAYGREWTQFGNGPDHPGRYQGSLGTEQWTQRWEYASSQLNPLAVAAGKVFVVPTGNLNNYLYAIALDAATGAEAWRAQFLPGNSMNPPSYHRGVMYTQRGNNSSDTQLFALDVSNGSVLWSTPHNAQWNRYFSPAVSDLGVYVHGGTFGGIYGFNRTTGAQKFFLDLEQQDEWTPAIHEGKVYSYVNGTFRNHHTETGAVLWSTFLGWYSGTIKRTICCEGGRAYVTNNSYTGITDLICLDLQAQSVAWRVTGTFIGTPAIANGLVYSCHGGLVKTFNATTGRWMADYTAPGETLLNGAPVVSNDLLLIGSASKTYIFNLNTRALIQTLPFGSQIAVVDDLLYLSCSDTKVRVYGRPGPANQVPVALAAQVGILEESEVAITLEGTDGDGAALSYVVRTLPAQGTLFQTTDGVVKGKAITHVPAQVMNSSGKVIYQAPLNVFGNGAGSFTFTANDQVSASAVATIAVNVTPVNDPPTAIADVIGLRPGESLLNFRPEANDRDPDGDTLTVVAFTQGMEGQVSQSADGSLQYVPAAGFISGTDQFTYTIQDTGNVQATTMVTITVSATEGRSWPTFGAGPEHTGFLPSRQGTAVFAQLWQASLGSTPKPPAVAQGRVHVSLQSSPGSIVTLDAATGAELWRSNFPTGTSVNPVTCHDGRVFMQSGNHSSSRFYSLDATTGVTQWNSPFSAQWENYMAPVADATGVFMNGGSYGGMYGFNPASGAQLFFQSLEQVDMWTPALHNGGLCSYIRGIFRSHGRTTGATVWSLTFPWSGSGINRTIACANNHAFVINDSIFVPSGDQEIINVDLSTRAVTWKARGRFTGTPALGHEAVYAISGGNTLKAYDVATGAYLGVFTLPGTESGLLMQPIVTADSLIAASGSKTYVFSIGTRALRQTIPYGGHVCLAGESLYIASSDGTLRAFSVPDTLNKAPAALAQTATTQEDTRVTLTLQGTDADNDTLNFVIATLPASGTLHQTLDGLTPGSAITMPQTLVTNAMGKVIYQPPADRHGTPLTTFQFAAGDGKSLSAPATATVNVQSVNDAPLARADARGVTPGQILSPVRELLNDFDVDGDALAITAFTQPGAGTVVQNTDGTLRYQAPPGITSGTEQFSYTVTDTAGASTTATVTITIDSTVSGAWPTFGNGPAHTGYSSSSLGRTGWAQRWSFSASGSNFSLKPVASAGGRLFVSYRDSASRVVALDLGNGAQLWARSLPNAFSLSPPSHHAGRVYVQRGNHNNDTQLIAFQADNGDTLWSASHAAQWDTFMAPAVNDAGVFVNGGMYGGVYGFAPNNGSQLFYQTKPDQDAWTPSIVDSEVYTFVNGDLVRHHPVTGAVLWTRSLGWGGYNMDRTTALDSRRAYLVNDSPSAAYDDEDLTCINLDTQAVDWSVNGQFNGTPAVSNGIVFVISGRTVQARTTASGGGLIATYQAPAGSYLYGQPVVTDDLVIVSSDISTFIFGRYDQVLLQTLNRGGHPAVVDDALIIASPGTGTVSAWAAQPAITFTPPGGSFSQPVSVVIGAADPATKIHYTVDGSAPDFTSPWLVSGSTVRMSWSGTLRAISVKGSDVSRIHAASFIIADTDNDGIADWWEIEKFGLLTKASAFSDSDGDGMTDAIEFAAGTSPLSATDRVEGILSNAEGAPGESIVLRWNSKAGRLYVVETSENLATWKQVTAVLPGTGGMMEHSINVETKSRHFSRVRVLPALMSP